MKLATLALSSALIVLPSQAAELTQTAATDAAMQSSASQTTGWIARAALTSAVEDREPVDSLTSLSNDSTVLYYFTEVRDMAGQTVKHRWEYGDQVMAEVEFEIGGPRWRIYSSKNLQPGWTGDWKVSVLDAAGNPLSVNTFVYSDTTAGTSSGMPADTSSGMPAGTSSTPQ